MSIFSIDADKCRRDGICAAVCPLRLILPADQDHLPQAIGEAAELCINCGHCAAACPHGALELAAMPLASLAEIKPELKISPAQAEQFLRSRRSIRNFKSEELPRETLEHLIEVARYAPSGHNVQPVQWLVVSGRDKLQPLAGQVIAWMEAVIKSGDPMANLLHMDRVVDFWRQGRDPILRGAPHLVLVHAPKAERTAPQACTLAIAFLDLIAHANQVGACWAGFFNAAAIFFPPLKKALGLPEEHVACGALMVGRPAETYWRIPDRKPAPIAWL